MGPKVEKRRMMSNEHSNLLGAKMINSKDKAAHKQTNRSSKEGGRTSVFTDFLIEINYVL